MQAVFGEREWKPVVLTGNSEGGSETVMPTGCVEDPSMGCVDDPYGEMQRIKMML
jgi:hypothetical protein